MKGQREKFDTDGFAASVRKGEFAPVYFFYGEEDFLIQECTDLLLAHAVDPSLKEFNVDVLTGGETTGETVLSIVTSYPMMSERRLVIVKDFEKVSGNELLADYFDHPSHTTVLAVTAVRPDMRRKPFNILKKSAVGGEFRQLYESEAVAWIESKMKRAGRAIEPQAAVLLQSFVGNSLRALANELEKLIIATEGRGTITVRDVESVVGISKEFTVFELTSKVGEKNLLKAVEIAERLLDGGESAVPVIAALTSHFMKLWKVQDGLRQRRPESELAQLTGAHQFFLKSYIAQAKNYTPQELEIAFMMLAEADLLIKSSADPHLVLTDTIVRIVSAAGTYQSVAVS